MTADLGIDYLTALSAHSVTTTYKPKPLERTDSVFEALILAVTRHLSVVPYPMTSSIDSLGGRVAWDLWDALTPGVQAALANKLVEALIVTSSFSSDEGSGSALMVGVRGTVRDRQRGKWEVTFREKAVKEV